MIPIFSINRIAFKYEDRQRQSSIEDSLNLITTRRLPFQQWQSEPIKQRPNEEPTSEIILFSFIDHPFESWEGEDVMLLQDRLNPMDGVKWMFHTWNNYTALWELELSNDMELVGVLPKKHILVKRKDSKDSINIIKGFEECFIEYKWIKDATDI